jgi:Kef-type K+ transport system membrane component KefB
VESGYGQLVLEVGFVGLLLWIGLSFSIGWTAWQVVNSLKGTPWFPLAFSIFWFAFLLLIPMAYYSFQAYQDFVMNAYLWFFLGILFRLKSFITAKRNPDQEQHSAIVPT